MATTPQTPFSQHGRFIGRVGALAVALGIGAAIAHGSAVAMADDGSSSSESASASKSADTGQRDKPSDSPAETTKRDTEEQDTGDDERVAETPEVSEDEPNEPDDESRRDTKRTAKADSPPADEDDADEVTDEPAEQAPAAAAVSAGSARHDASVETKSVTVAATDSPLGTEQQLEAETIAARTVKTLPVQLMKLVLAAGWLTTAQREYSEMGGIDWKNYWHLGRSIDEYALGAAFQQQLLNPMKPTVVTQVAPPHSWYGTDVAGSRILYDNPDTVYRFMGVNMTSTYVIKGQFTGDLPADTNFSVLTGLSGITADNLSGRDLLIEPDSTFTITVSGDAAAPGQRNHLQLTADTTLIAVRNTLSDWGTNLR